jgi:CHAD domain-containing protein
MAQPIESITSNEDRTGPPGPGDLRRSGPDPLPLPEPGAPLSRIHRDDPLVLAARKVVARQTQMMRANVQGALEDVDPEYLHDLRVAARRLRSALRLFAGILGPKRSDALRLGLGWIGQVMGKVRDLDALALNLQAHARALEASGAVVDLLVAELRRQRQPARRALQAALASRRFWSLLRRLEALGASPPPRRPRGDQGAPVAAAAPALIRKAHKRVLRLGRVIGPDSPATDLHRLRILCKRLRYTCEFFQEAFVEPLSGEDPLKPEIRGMVHLQDCLGEHQDAAIAVRRIEALVGSMVEAGTLAAQDRLQVEDLMQVQRQIMQERRARFAKLWAQFDRRSVRKRLAHLAGR